MRYRDARHLSPEAQAEKRATAFRMREQGYTQDAIVKVVEVHRSTLNKWFKRAREQGKAQALRGGTRGARVGTNRRLTPIQEKRIQVLLKNHMPDELGLPDALWTRRSVIALVRARCHVTLPLSTMGVYLKRWGFSPQKPLNQAYERQPRAVQTWLNEVYPAIQARADKEQADIHWGDEMGIQNRCQAGRSYALVGKTPVQRHAGKRLKINVISTVTAQGLIRFMIYTDSLTAERFIQFLTRLIRGSTVKIFLIVDNLKVHHSLAVQEWVRDHKAQLELFFLPSYSSDLNPDEYLNGDVKAQVQSAKSPRHLNTLKQQVNKALRYLQKHPERVRKYFEHSAIAYAA